MGGNAEECRFCAFIRSRSDSCVFAATITRERDKTVLALKPFPVSLLVQISLRTLATFSWKLFLPVKLIYFYYEFSLKSKALKVGKQVFIIYSMFRFRSTTPKHRTFKVFYQFLFLIVCRTLLFTPH